MTRQSKVYDRVGSGMIREGLSVRCEGGNVSENMDMDKDTTCNWRRLGSTSTMRKGTIRKEDVMCVRTRQEMTAQ